VKKETGKPRWQAARPSARQTCVFPVPDGITQSNNIVAGDEIFTAREFECQRLAERWNGGEVECVETLHHRKTGSADAALDHAPFTIDEFKLGKAQEEADMIETLAGGFGGELFILAQEGRQFELTQMIGRAEPAAAPGWQQEPRRHAALPEMRTI
jgi:hypothetical protein